MNTKVNILIASLYEREDCLLDTIESLLPQLKSKDTINLYLQNYTEAPKVLKYKEQFKNINIIYDWEYKDMQSKEIRFAELGYFLFEDIKGYVFLLDDDLIYPTTYIEDTILAYKKYNKDDNGIVSYHGNITYKRPIANYYADRTQLQALGEVFNDTPCDILGTGVMCYHSDVFNFQKSSNGLEKYSIHMRDIHISLQAKREDLTLTCLSHAKGYIGYNRKMMDKPTIFDSYVNNPTIQTKLINDFELPLELWQQYTKPNYQPTVNIVVINSRQLTHPQYVKQCFDSIREQSYPIIKPVIVSNYEKLMTIGKCWNEGVKICQGEWVFFLGDDDFITEDYIQSLITEYNNLPYDIKEKVAGISSFCTIFRDSGEMERKDIIPTGMWKREYLIKYPFQEYLTRLVDSSYMQATKDRGYILHTMQHHYGLYYRSHATQVSGTKALSSEETTQVSYDIQKKLAKMNLEN